MVAFNALFITNVFAFFFFVLFFFFLCYTMIQFLTRIINHRKYIKYFKVKEEIFHR